jgi:murein L,D-transpeptidase YafK
VLDWLKSWLEVRQNFKNKYNGKRKPRSDNEGHLKKHRSPLLNVSSWYFFLGALFLSASLPAFADSPESLTPDPVVQNPPEGKVPQTLVSLSSDTHYAFVVDKAKRTLTLWKNSKIPSLVAAYPTDMGKEKGNKLYRGDSRTPEGIYFFQQTYQQPYLDFELYGQRAFTMDYPNFFDRREKKTGGGIWLHAIPDTKSLNRGSRGCVVVRNDVIDKLKVYIELKKTPVIVQNQVDYLSPEEWLKQQSDKTAWLKNWKEAWESKNIDAYMAFYGNDFKSSGMDLKHWKKFKESLNEKYQFIKVALHKADIFKNRDQYIFRFAQDYQSDQNHDVGVKYLYVKDENGTLKILGEDWNRADTTTTLSSSETPPDRS